jgi:hypothetical protein
MNSNDPRISLTLDRSVPFVDAVFRILDGTGTEVEAVNILRDIERLCEVELSTAKQTRALEEIPLERYSELVEDRMNKFLSATHFAIGSAEYNQLRIVIMKRYTYPWTHREWANMLAKWANKTSWLGWKSWNYLDFYGGPNDRLIENYDVWIETALRIVRTKSADE